MSSWIKMHRSLLQWEWYDDLPTRVLFMHLLLKVEYAPGRYQGHDVPVGSCVTGINKLSEQTGLTIQQTRTALKKLESTNEVTIKSTNKFSIVSIRKWEEYQGSNKQSTNDQQTDNKRVTTSKEVKKERKKEIISSYEDSPLDDAVEIFHRVCSGLPSIRKLTTTRKQKLRRRLKDDFGDDLRQWEGYCARIAASPFLMGANDKGWTADLDWILEPRNLNRILEGKYDERPGAKQKTTDAYLAGFGAAAFEEQV